MTHALQVSGHRISNEELAHTIPLQAVEQSEEPRVMTAHAGNAVSVELVYPAGRPRGRDRLRTALRLLVDVVVLALFIPGVVLLLGIPLALAVRALIALLARLAGG